MINSNVKLLSHSTSKNAVQYFCWIYVISLLLINVSMMCFCSWVIARKMKTSLFGTYKLQYSKILFTYPGLLRTRTQTETSMMSITPGAKKVKGLAKGPNSGSFVVLRLESLTIWEENMWARVKTDMNQRLVTECKDKECFTTKCFTTEHKGT